MAINRGYDEEAIAKEVARAVEEFYKTLIERLDTIQLKDILRRKNPYLFRVKSLDGAAQIVSSLLSAYVSSSEETIFGKVFFEPIALVASKGEKALTTGVDIIVRKRGDIYALAVKSGTSVFNSDSKKKQEQNFTAAGKLAQQAKKRFIPIVGYCYGRKNSRESSSPKIYQELAGQEFWEYLTGDKEFYIKLLNYMGNLPEEHVDDFGRTYKKAENRLIKEFTQDYCLPDGSIDWENLVKFNSSSDSASK